MTTATFSSKRSMYLGALQRNIPIGIFYTVLLTAFFPLMYIMTLMTSDRTVNEFSQYNHVQMNLHGFAGIYGDASSIAMFLICAVMPIVFGALFFSYLHSKKAVDVYHALPMKRQDMFSAHYFAGLTMLCVPLILCYVIILIAGAFQSAMLGAWYHPGKILIDMLVWLVGIAAIYSITAATAVFGGTTLNTVLYALAMCGMYPVLLLLVQSATNEILIGVSYQLWDNSLFNSINLLSLSPFTLHLYLLTRSPHGLGTIVDTRSRFLFNGIAIVIWALIAAGIFFAVRELYVRRKSELAGRPAPASMLSRIAQYALVFATATILGILMGEGFRSSVSALIGVVLGGGIAYATFEAVIARGFRTFPKAFVHMGISVALPFALFVILLTGGLGYEDRVPAVDQVESVSINYSGRFREPHMIYVQEVTDRSMAEGGTNWWETATPVVLTNPEAIEIVRQYHTTVIQEAKGRHWNPERDWEDYANFSPTITYRLKNGNTVQRTYSASSNEAVKALAGLEDLDEFKEQTNPAFLMEPGELGEISFSNRLGIEVERMALPEDQQKVLLEALRSDAKNETLKDMLDGTKATLGYVRLWRNDVNYYEGKEVPDDMAEILITEGYTNTIAWLKANGIYDKMQIDVDQIKNAAIIEFDRFNGKFRERSSDSIFFTLWPAEAYEDKDWIYQSGNDYGVLLMEDKADIEKLLAAAKNYGSNTGEGGYWVYFQYDSKSSLKLFIAESQMPEELLKEYQEAYPAPQG